MFGAKLFVVRPSDIPENFQCENFSVESAQQKLNAFAGNSSLFDVAPQTQAFPKRSATVADHEQVAFSQVVLKAAPTVRLVTCERSARLAWLMLVSVTSTVMLEKPWVVRNVDPAY